MKRLARERERLPENSQDCFINWKDDNLTSFDAYIVGPEDSLYKHKFIKLKFDVPSNYPLIPPKVKFIQHSGDRIHPNLYIDGKVCLSILGTWPGDPWSYSMTIEGVLITIRSLLDNNPYLHEPKQSDNPAFNRYVRYNTWRWLLLEYLDHERDSDAKAFLQQYIQQHGTDMVAELERQRLAEQYCGQLTSPYMRGRSQIPDYDTLLRNLRTLVAANRKPSEQNEAAQNDQRKRKASDGMQ